MKISKWQFKGLIILFVISALIATISLLTKEKSYIPEIKTKINILSDTSELKKIPYIGTKRAISLHNFIHFWKKLHSVDNLSDIYNFDTTTVKKIEKYLYIPDTLLGEINKLNLNTISEDSLIKSAILPEYLAKRLINYRQKVKYLTWDNVSKIYGMKPKYYIALQKYFYIIPKSKENKIIKIELNTATPQDLEKLPGIGKTLSNRIVKFRKLLGFFYSKKQLLEVYGLTPEIYEKIKDKIYIKHPLPNNKLNINELDAYALMKHPYIPKVIAFRIVKYRKKYGKYKSVEDLKKIYGITDSLYNKLKWYIKI